MTLEVTDGNIIEVLKQNEITVLQFSAEWCGPCRMLSPIIDILSTEEVNNTVTIGKINVDANPVLSAKYGIRSIPTIIFLKNGEIANRMVGVNSQDDIQAKIDSLKY
jgi:thioredoxin 1